MFHSTPTPYEPRTIAQRLGVLCWYAGVGAGILGALLAFLLEYSEQAPEFMIAVLGAAIFGGVPTLVGLALGYLFGAFVPRRPAPSSWL